jgi:hypothetical protein
MHAMTSEMDGAEWSASCPGCFISKKEHLIPTKQEAGWTPKMIWILYGKKKTLGPVMSQNLITWSPIPKPTY